ncbi:MAG: hypothetical protein JXR37_21995 [Kiritimatiellae bacterium]|nr:hypothetical protein [Kiritimatiellia bacterium]
MEGSRERVQKAFAHEAPDRTPLMEIFQLFQPIYWDVCGRNFVTDAAMHWDAKSDGVSWEELVEAEAQARFTINKFFEVDICHLYSNSGRHFSRPTKTGPKEWESKGAKYVFDEKTKRVVLANPGAAQSHTQRRQGEEATRRELEAWDGTVPKFDRDRLAVYRRVRELAEADGIDWVYMWEGCSTGTGAAFYPPWLLMWIILEPGLFRRWLDKKKAEGFAGMEAGFEADFDIFAIGGDVSSDNGPFISPAHYREFILPNMQEQVARIHEAGKLAVYTSDGNHWAIKDDFFFSTNIDGYKEVDKAAGMTFERLIAEGIAEKVCIIGNMDARHTMCLGSTEDAKRETRECLDFGRRTPGGHILHLSHSVHEDVKVENYDALVEGYREYFGLAPLPERPRSAVPAGRSDW